MQLNAEHIAHVLNAGAQGVLVARVNSAADVRTILDAANFYPEGKRTVFFTGRGTNFGLDLAGKTAREFSLEVNRETLIGCIIEEVSRSHSLDEILSFPEIDMVHLGPVDLAHSMGWPAKEQVDAAGDKIVAAAVSAGKAMSTTWGVRSGTSQVSDMADVLAKGYRMFVLSPRASFVPAVPTSFNMQARRLDRQVSPSSLPPPGHKNDVVQGVSFAAMLAMAASTSAATSKPIHRNRFTC